jgi:hypothetical protein
MQHNPFFDNIIQQEYSNEFSNFQTCNLIHNFSINIKMIPNSILPLLNKGNNQNIN